MGASFQLSEAYVLFTTKGQQNVQRAAARIQGQVAKLRVETGRLEKQQAQWARTSHTSLLKLAAAFGAATYSAGRLVEAASPYAMDTLRGSFTLLWSEIGKDLIPAVVSLSRKIQDLYWWWKDMTPEVRAQIQEWAKWALAAGAAAVALAALGPIIRATAGLFSAVLGPAISGVTSLIVANPWVAFAAVLTGTVATALVYVTKKMEDLKKAGEDVVAMRDRMNKGFITADDVKGSEIHQRLNTIPDADQRAGESRRMERDLEKERAELLASRYAGGEAKGMMQKAKEALPFGVGGMFMKGGAFGPGDNKFAGLSDDDAMKKLKEIDRDIAIARKTREAAAGGNRLPVGPGGSPMFADAGKGGASARAVALGSMAGPLGAAMAGVMAAAAQKAGAGGAPGGAGTPERPLLRGNRPGGVSILADPMAAYNAIQQQSLGMSELDRETLKNQLETMTKLDQLIANTATLRDPSRFNAVGR